MLSCRATLYLLTRVLPILPVQVADRSVGFRAARQNRGRGDLFIPLADPMQGRNLFHRVIGLMAAILSAMHMQRADDLFGMPNGSPITDRIIDASIQ